MIYLDNAATTQVDDRVLQAMAPYHNVKFGNPSSIHRHGREAFEAIDDARREVADAISARPGNIVFTSGGTESDNMAVLGVALANRDRGKHLITSAIEHHAVLHAFRHLETLGFRVTYLPVGRDGLVSLADLEDAITAETTLISIMAANNEIGTIEPVKAIGEMAHEHGALFHTDAVQAVTKMPLDVNGMSIDLLSMSSHKFHGPKGVGALFRAHGVRIDPISFGGGQERGLRPSTENVPGIVGMGKAIALEMPDLDRNNERMATLRDKIIEKVSLSIPRSHLNGHRSERLCNNVNLRFDGVDGEGLVLALDQEGISTSTGSACSSRDSGPSHVLQAIGLDREQCKGSLRITLSRMSREEDVDIFLDIIPKVVGALREKRK